MSDITIDALPGGAAIAVGDYFAADQFSFGAYHTKKITGTQLGNFIRTQQYYHTIQDIAAVSYTQRPILQFQNGFTISDDAGDNLTKVALNTTFLNQTYVPLAGTIPSYPIAGDLEIDSGLGTFAIYTTGGGHRAELFYNPTTDIGLKYTDTGTSQYSSISVSNVGAIVESTVPTFAGLRYSADYSANYTSRSLIDKGFADGRYGLLTGNLSQFAATTSAQLAGIISDETGTGSLVFNTSPTFITGITVPNIYGSAASGGNLSLFSTSHATKGKIYIGGATGSAITVNETTGTFSIGNDAQNVTIAGVTYDIGFSCHNNVGTFINNEIHSASNTATLGAVQIGTRSRGTYGTPLVVQNGDNILDFYGVGYDGTDYAIATAIEHEVDNTVAANQVPGRIKFSTANSVGTLVERLRISSSLVTLTGDVSIHGVTSTAATGTGNLVFATAPTLTNPIVGTQSQGDNSTKAASTAYVDTGLSNQRWTEHFQWASLAAPADATAYLATDVPDLTLASSARIKKFAYAGTVSEAVITFNVGTAGSSESVTFYLRDITGATDSLIGTATWDSSGMQSIVYSGLSIAVNTTSDYALKVLTPTWVTLNPLAVRGAATLYAK